MGQVPKFNTVNEDLCNLEIAPDISHWHIRLEIGKQFQANFQFLAKLTNRYWICCFVHPIFEFWFLVTFGDEVPKIWSNLCLHFARQDGRDGKNGKKIMQLKLPKYQKPKDQNMGWTKPVSSKHIFCSANFNIIKCHGGHSI